MDRERVRVDALVSGRYKLVQTLFARDFQMFDGAHISHGVIVGKTLAVYR